MPFSASVLCEVVEEMVSLSNFYAMTCFSYCHATKLLDLLTRPQRFPRKEGRVCEISFYFRYLQDFLENLEEADIILSSPLLGYTVKPLVSMRETGSKATRTKQRWRLNRAFVEGYFHCCDLQNAEWLICEENLTMASKYTRILILAEIYREKMENPTTKATECMQTTLLTPAASTVRY